MLFDDRVDPGRMPRLMVAPTAALIVVALALTVFAGPILGICQRAAEDLNDPHRYLGTVLGPPETWQSGGNR